MSLIHHLHDLGWRSSNSKTCTAAFTQCGRCIDRMHPMELQCLAKKFTKIEFNGPSIERFSKANLRTFNLNPQQLLPSSRIQRLSLVICQPPHTDLIITQIGICRLNTPKRAAFQQLCMVTNNCIESQSLYEYNKHNLPSDTGFLTCFIPII